MHRDSNDTSADRLTADNNSQDRKRSRLEHPSEEHQHSNDDASPAKRSRTHTNAAHFLDLAKDLQNITLDYKSNKRNRSDQAAHVITQLNSMSHQDIESSFSSDPEQHQTIAYVLYNAGKIASELSVPKCSCSWIERELSGRQREKIFLNFFI